MMQEYFAEEGFRGFMRGVVEPYLKKYQKKGYFNSFDGAPLFYYTYCQADAKAALVISHGFCEFAEKYQELIYYFLQEGCSVYLLEHRGHGYSKRETGDVQKVHITHFEDYIRGFCLFCGTHRGKQGREQNLICTFHGRCDRSALSGRIPGCI